MLDDSSVPKAVKRQIPFSIAYPNSLAAKGIEQMAQRFVSGQDVSDDPRPNEGVKGFLNKMIKLLR
jgi:flagellar biosynthesis protein FlhG